MKHSFEQLKKIVSQLHLSSEEKSVLRARLHRHMTSYDPSPMSRRAPRWITWGNVMFKATAFALVIVISAGGSLAYASQDSLPGEILYTFKTNISEPLVQFSKISDEAQGSYAIELASRRLDETAVLLKKGDLNPQTAEVLQENFQNHITQAEEINQKIAYISPETSLALASELQASIRPRVALLKKLDNALSPTETLIATAESYVTNADSTKQDSTLAFADRKDSATRIALEKKTASVQSSIENLRNLSEKQTVLATTLATDTIPVANNEEGNREITEEFSLTSEEGFDQQTMTESAETSENQKENSNALLVSAEIQNTPSNQSTATKQQVQAEWLLQEAEQKIQEEDYSQALLLLQEAEEIAKEGLIIIDLSEEFSVTIEDISSTSISDTLLPTTPLQSSEETLLLLNQQTSLGNINVANQMPNAQLSPANTGTVTSPKKIQ